MKFYKLAVVIGVLAAGGATMFAAAKKEDGAAPAAKQEAAKKGGQAGKMEKMKKDLNLTDAQATKIEAIMKEQGTARTALMNESKALSPDEKKAKMAAFNKEWDGKIKAVLNAEQKEKFEKAQAGRAGGGKAPAAGEKKEKADKKEKGSKKKPAPTPAE